MTTAIFQPTSKIILTGLLFTACAATSQPKISDQEMSILQKVQVRKEDPPQNCRFVSPVEATDGHADALSYHTGSFTQTMLLLQLYAARKGANFVVIDSEQSSVPGNPERALYILRGRAFSCP